MNINSSLLNIYKKTYHIFIADAFVFFITFLNSILISRYLGPEIRGKLGIIQLWSGIVLTLGFCSFNEYLLISKRKISLKIFNTNIFIFLCFLSFFSLPFYYFILEGKEFEIRKYFYIYTILLIPINYLTQIILAEIQLKGESFKFNIYRSVTPIFCSIGVILLILINKIELIFILSMYFISNLFLLYLMRHSLNENFTLRLTNLNYIFKFYKSFKVIFYNHLSTVLALLSQNIDKILISIYANNQEIGIYFVAYSIASLGFNFISNALGTSLFPEISFLRNTKFLEESLIKLLIVYLIYMAIFYFSIPELIPLVFGDKYYFSINISIWIAFACIFGSLKNLFVKLLKGLSLSKLSSETEIFFTIIFLIIWVYLQNFDKINILFVCAYSLIIANITSLFFVTFRYKHINR